MVATAGNFLIDSQMQLAGKPSLIDPTRAIAKGKEATGPLVFESLKITPIDGEAGQQLERLYAAYFDVQQALASDKTPPEVAAQALHATASQLEEDKSLPQDAAKLVQEIAAKSEHLHHMQLAEARKAFKPVSQAVVKLAAQVRAEGAQNPFTHFYCPMVPGGGGDWLQSNDQLLNPYFGSEMLRCGEKVHQFPTQGDSSSPPDLHREHEAQPLKQGAA